MSWTEKRPIGKPAVELPSPPGYTTQALKKGQKVVTTSADDRATLQVKKAWEVALAPLKSLPMSAIMTWFSGSSIQIFSIMMTGSLFWTPIKILMDPFAPFKPLETEKTHDRLWMPKMVFLLGQVLSIVLGIIKLQYMGLLPTTSSDWLAWEYHEPTNSRIEFV